MVHENVFDKSFTNYTKGDNRFPDFPETIIWTDSLPYNRSVSRIVAHES